MSGEAPLRRGEGQTVRIMVRLGAALRRSLEERFGGADVSLRDGWPWRATGVIVARLLIGSAR
jgi:hypothetical protein